MDTNATQNLKDLVNQTIRAQLAVRIYPFPTSDPNPPKIGVHLLTDREIDYARLEAGRYCVKQKVDLEADPEFLEREVQRQIVWRSVCDPEIVSEDGSGPSPLFLSDEDVRLLPSTVIECLHRLYLEHQDAISPLRTLTAERVPALVESIGKGDPHAFSNYDHESLVRIIRALAAELAPKEPHAG